MQTDLNEDVAGVTDFGLVNQHHIGGNDPGFLELAHAPQTGGFGKIDLGCQIDVAEASLALQQVQNVLVDTIYIHFRIFLLIKINLWIFIA